MWRRRKHAHVRVAVEQQRVGQHAVEHAPRGRLSRPALPSPTAASRAMRWLARLLGYCRQAVAGWPRFIRDPSINMSSKHTKRVTTPLIDIIFIVIRLNKPSFSSVLLLQRSLVFRIIFFLVILSNVKYLCFYCINSIQKK